MSIYRKLPATNVSRQKALNNAREKNNATPGNDVLKASTASALNTGANAYNLAMQDAANAKALLNTKTPQKDIAVAISRYFISHFIQVFNFGVVRGKYAAGHRAFYHLEAGSDALPDLRSEDNVRLWGHYIVDGDVARLAAGGAPMLNPDALEVQGKLSEMESLLNEQSTLDDALDAKQEVIDNLNEDADVLIRKIWDEVESTYGSETPESKRHNCRQWGVVYVTDGIPATLSGLVKNSGGAAVAGATVTIDETGATATTNAEGRYTIDTVMLGDITIHATLGLLTGNRGLNIPDHTTGLNINVEDITIA